MIRAIVAGGLLLILAAGAPVVTRRPRLELDARSLILNRLHTMKQRAANGCCPVPSIEPDLRPVEGKEADDELAALAKAIGHPARIQILRILVRKTACVCGDIVDEMPLAQSTVSQHLKVLKEAGLIRGEVDGPRVCYCIEPRALRRLRVLMAGM